MEQELANMTSFQTLEGGVLPVNNTTEGLQVGGAKRKETKKPLYSPKKGKKALKSFPWFREKLDSLPQDIKIPIIRNAPRTLTRCSGRGQPFLLLGTKPVNRTIRQILDYGYAHHIQRLRVLGNFIFSVRFIR